MLRRVRAIHHLIQNRPTDIRPRLIVSSACSFQNNTAKLNQNSCWKCQRDLIGSQFFLQCPHCGTLQKIQPDAVNYFDIFNVPQNYKVDLSQLAKAMKKLQKNLHPDVFSLKSSEEREMSESLSSLVNKGYAVLQNPMERAQYLLKLNGISEWEMEKKMTADLEFLGEVMELNERLEQIKDAETWAQFRKENNQKIEILSKELEHAFSSGNIEGAVMVLSKLKYYDNLQKKLKDVQSRLGVVD